MYTNIVIHKASSPICHISQELYLSFYIYFDYKKQTPLTPFCVKNQNEVDHQQILVYFQNIHFISLEYDVKVAVQFMK